MSIAPFPYQRPVVRAIEESLRANRAHVDTSFCGAGKTFMSLFAAREVSQNIMVIAPISVHNDWVEAAKATKARVLWVSNIEALKLDETVLTKTIVRKKTVFIWKPVPIDAVLIVDEQHRCGGESQYSQVVRHFPNRRVILLSATPADSILKTKTMAHVLGICPTNLFWSWVQKTYKARKGFFGGLQISKANDDAALADFRERLTRTGQISGLVKSELGDAFPEVQILTKAIEVDNPREIDQAYIADLELLRDESEVAAVAFLRSRQMAEIAMIPVIQEMIDDLVEQGMRVITFVNYKATLERLKTDVYYHGEMKPEDRTKSVQGFQDGDAKSFGATSSCGGESITLDDQVGDAPRAILLCPGVSAREVIQCVGRGNRAKSKSKLLVYLLFPHCSSGDRIRKLVAAKTQRIETLVDSDII